ncbi:MAG: heavy-metal-associated domain-containing protein [Opitutaceae bacterium]
MRTKIRTIAAAAVAMILALSVALAQTAPTHAYIQVKGLACPFCVQGLEKHLKKIPGVAGVTTSLEKGEVVVHIEDPQKVTEDELRKAVKNAGFTAGTIRIEKGDGADRPADPKPSGGRK